MSELLDPTPRTTVRRKADRGRYERSIIHAILDEADIAHVGFVIDGEPRVLPMAFGRVGDALYLHGAVGNAMLRAVSGAPICVTVTLVDGLVLARSAFHHSMNYRCVVVLGEATRVTDLDEQRAAAVAIVDHTVPGRSTQARMPTDAELRATAIVRVAIDEASAKVRTGGPIDDDEDLGLPVWAGVIPIRRVFDDPEPDPAQAGAGLTAPSARVSPRP